MGPGFMGVPFANHMPSPFDVTVGSIQDVVRQGFNPAADKTPPQSWMPTTSQVEEAAWEFAQNAANWMGVSPTLWAGFLFQLGQLDTNRPWSDQPIRSQFLAEVPLSMVGEQLRATEVWRRTGPLDGFGAPTWELRGLQVGEMVQLVKVIRICRWWSGGARAGYPDADPLESHSLMRLASDSKQPFYDVNATAASLDIPDPTNQLGKIKLGQVLDQSDDSEITNPNPVIEEQGLANFFKACLGPPLEEECPTLSQWVALFYRVFKQKATAFADFAVWLPFGDLIAKEMKYQVWKETGFGEHRQLERKGPSNLLQWEASWRVFRVAMIGLGLAAPAILDAYCSTFKTLVGEYPECWGLCYEAELHARRVKAAAFRRSAEMAFAMGESWARSFNPERPWEFTFLLLSNKEHEYWTTRIRRPAELWLMRTGGKTGAPLTQEQRLAHMVAPGLVMLPGGASASSSSGGGGGGGGIPPPQVAKKKKARPTGAVKKLRKQLAALRQVPGLGTGGGSGKGLGAAKVKKKLKRQGFSAQADGKGKGKGKGRAPDGRECCYSWGRARDGPCKDMGPNTDGQCPNKRAHLCEFCGKADHKSKNCSNKPTGCAF